MSQFWVGVWAMRFDIAFTVGVVAVAFGAEAIYNRRRKQP